MLPGSVRPRYPGSRATLATHRRSSYADGNCRRNHQPFLSANVVIAQTPPANAPAASKTSPTAKPPEKPRTAESIECSKQADAKGLHGKERQTFRSKCMKDLKKKT